MRPGASTSRPSRSTSVPWRFAGRYWILSIPMQSSVSTTSRGSIANKATISYHARAHHNVLRWGSCTVFQCTCFIGENAHEICQAGDLKYLYIMVAQAAGQQAVLGLACPCQQTDNKGNARTIDILHIAEIEQDGTRFLALSFIIGGIQYTFCTGINFSVQINDGNTWLVAHVRLQSFTWHGSLLPNTRSIRRYGGSRRW